MYKRNVGGREERSDEVEVDVVVSVGWGLVLPKYPWWLGVNVRRHPTRYVPLGSHDNKHHIEIESISRVQSLTTGFRLEYWICI